MPLALPKVRDDLLYSPDHEAPGYSFVKCPVRNDFFRFNNIQIALMKAMDGRTTTEELIEQVGDEFEAEMDAEQLDRFAARLSERFLLDVSSYQADDKATSKEIRKRLRKKGLFFRAKARDESNPEAQLFAQGMEQAVGNNPLQASSYFQAILEINPHNKRAREVLDCINEAFLNIRRKDMAHQAKSLPLVNPDEFLGHVDRVAGRYIFSWLGILAILAISLVQVVLLVDTVELPEFQLSRFTTIDGLAMGVVVLSTMLIHELGHALACKHYGGHPTELGLQLILGIMPAAYCDASDTYLFKSSRHKVICFLSGMPAQLVAATFFLAILQLIDPSTPGWLGAALAPVFGTLNMYQNLNPLIPFDGYYALADHLKILNLRERAFKYVWLVLARVLFGVTTEEYLQVEDKHRRPLFIFGVLAMVYTLVWIVVIMLNLFVPLAVEYLGVVGVLLVFFYFFGQVRLAYRTLVRPFASFLLREQKQIFSARRSIVYVLVIGAAVWGLGLQNHTYIEGKMVIEPAEVAAIVAVEAGVVEAVHVEEGQSVLAGDVLFELHSEELQREMAQAIPEVAIAELKLSMLEAGARPEEIEIVIAQHQSKRAQARSMTRRLQQSRSLERLDVGTKAEVLAARGAAVEATGAGLVTGAQVDVLRAGAREQELAAAVADLKNSQAKLESLQERGERLKVRALIDGRVTTRKLELLVGRWVGEGQLLCTIEDESSWQARIRPGLAEPIAGLAVGDRIVARAFGYPGREIEVRIRALLPPSDTDTESIIVESTVFGGKKWRSGLTGHARIYGPKRSFAYRWIALPLVQVFNVRIAPLFTGI